MWGKMIAEAAHYYIAKFPDIKDSTEYQAVGRQMLARYPSIKQEGKEAWVSFLLFFGQSLQLTIVGSLICVFPVLVTIYKDFEPEDQAREVVLEEKERGHHQ